MSNSLDIDLDWRLRVRMAENKIKTATELKRRLDAVGYNITSAQLSRIMDDRPAQIKTALLVALLKVLGGTLNDLLRVVDVEEASPDREPEPAASPTPKRARKPARPAQAAPNPDDAGGPRVRPFSVPKKSGDDAK